MASNTDLQLQGPTVKASGHGTADLVNEQLNYYLNAVAISAGLVSTDLTNIAIPIIITGPFNHLSIRPDVSAIFKGVLQNQLLKQSGKINKFLGNDIGNQIQKVIDVKSLLH